MNDAQQRGGLVILLTFILALLLTIIPLPEWARLFRPQWHTLVLIYWTLALPLRVSVGIGWTVGLIVDVMTGTLLGQHALALSLIAYITFEMHQRIRLFPLWQQSLTVLVLLLLERLLSLWVMGAVSRPPPPLTFWAPPVVGMALWPWIYILLRDVRRRFHVK